MISTNIEMRKKKKMKLKTLSIASLLTMIICFIPLVYSVDWTLPYNDLSSGYRVTTDPHGEDIMLGDPITAWAGTTNPAINRVVFRWNPPEGSPDVVDGTPQGFVDVPGVGIVYQWSSTKNLDVMGDWGVQGLFYNDDVTEPGQGPIAEDPGPTSIRARSAFVISEVAIGSIMAVAAMFTALGLFAYKKKHTPTKQ
jgi:hypothetical protein